MDFHIIIITITLGIVTAPNTTDKQPIKYPLFVAFFTQKQFYGIHDEYTILKQLKNYSGRRNLPFTRVILFCGFDKNKEKYDTLYMHYIIKTNFPNLRKVNCEHSFKPLIRPNKTGKGYNSGYYVYKNDELLKAYRLENFPFGGDEHEIIKDEQLQADYPYTYYAASQQHVDIIRTESDKNTDRDVSKFKYRIAIYWISWNKPSFATLQTIHRFVFFHCITNPSYAEYYKCPMMELEQEHLRNVNNLEPNISYYYNTDNQDKALENTNRPHSPQDTSKNEYFHQTLLTPSDDFCDHYLKLATCNHLNTVPIWKTIALGPLKNLEIFIQNLAQRLPINTLEVRTIAYEVLELPTYDGQTKRIYLDYQHSRIPAPKIIIKIIDYRAPSAHNPQQYNHYYLAFVVHNTIGHPVPKNERICGHSESTLCGFLVLEWYMHLATDTRKAIYCCALDDPAWQKIDIKLPSIHKRFNLKLLSAKV